jgi:hypothetical protein
MNEEGGERERGREGERRVSQMNNTTSLRS